MLGNDLPNAKKCTSLKQSHPCVCVCGCVRVSARVSVCVCAIVRACVPACMDGVCV